MTDKVLSRADFLSAIKNRNTYKRELVPLPDLGGAVYVYELSAEQIITYNERIQAMQKKGKKQVTPSTSIDMMAVLISMAVCDDAGAPLFTEDDVKDLRQTSPVILMTLSAKVLEVSGFNNAAMDEVISQLKKSVNDSSPTV